MVQKHNEWGTEYLCPLFSKPKHSFSGDKGHIQIAVPSIILNVIPYLYQEKTLCCCGCLYSWDLSTFWRIFQWALARWITCLSNDKKWTGSRAGAVGLNYTVCSLRKGLYGFGSLPKSAFFSGEMKIFYVNRWFKYCGL